MNLGRPPQLELQLHQPQVLPHPAEGDQHLRPELYPVTDPL